MEGAFRDPGLKLIETFGWDGTRFPRLGRHRDRMRNSAQALGFAFSDRAFDRALADVGGPRPQRVRLTLDRAGLYQLTLAAMAPAAVPWRLALAPVPVAADDPRLAHKTTDRALYDTVRAGLPDGCDEVIFLNERGEVAEGTITSVFFDLGAGPATPPLASGCLPGCLRAELLELGWAHEAVLTARDLPSARLWVGNSLRGLIPAVLRSRPDAPAAV